MALNPVTDVIEPIGALLETTTGVPTFFGRRHEHTKLRRFDWEPDGDIILEGPSRIGSYPRVLHDAVESFEVYIRADDYAAARQMMADLITAIRQTIGGEITYSVGNARHANGSGESTNNGWTIIVPVTLRCPLHESDLDQPQYTTVTIEDVGVSDENGVVGDGVLTAPAK